MGQTLLVQVVDGFGSIGGIGPARVARVPDGRIVKLLARAGESRPERRSVQEEPSVERLGQLRHERGGHPLPEVGGRLARDLGAGPLSGEAADDRDEPQRDAGGRRGHAIQVPQHEHLPVLVVRNEEALEPPQGRAVGAGRHGATVVYDSPREVFHLDTRFWGAVLTRRAPRRRPPRSLGRPSGHARGALPPRPGGARRAPRGPGRRGPRGPDSRHQRGRSHPLRRRAVAHHGRDRRHERRPRQPARWARAASASTSMRDCACGQAHRHPRSRALLMALGLVIVPTRSSRRTRWS